MGKGKALSVEEKAKIEAFEELKLSITEISKKTGRSRKVIYNFLRNKSGYGRNNKGGNNKVLSDIDKRAILREASNSHESTAKIRTNVGVKASLSTIQRVIRNASHLKRLKVQKKPPLNDARKELRLNFSREHMAWKSDWHYVVFSDEKKFNLEGPDGYNYYFHDLRKEEHHLDRLHSRVGGVMVWGAISYYGTCDLQFLNTNMNANTYKNVLETAFPRFKSLFGNVPWRFQHDNAPIHTARMIKSWIEAQNVDLLQWPPYSPDINIIENVWGWLARKVYESGRQYSTKEELIEGIKSAWSAISLNYIGKLYESLPNRIFEIILNKGGSTHY
uniref:Transposable element Tc3 transposase n=1 Tax=Bactrocera dorsalis TaxID=27457 RepID=A0A034VPZ2_BACDO